MSAIARYFYGLGLNLRMGLRSLWWVRQAKARVPDASLSQMLGLSVCALLVGVAVNLMDVGWLGGRLNLFALPNDIFPAVMMLLVALGLSRIGLRPRRFQALATMGLAVLFWHTLGSGLLALSANWNGLIDQYYFELSFVPFLWAGVAFAFAALRLLPSSTVVRKLVMVTLSVLVFLGAQTLVNPNLHLWMPVSAIGRDDVGMDAPQSEATLYGQLDLLNDALDEVAQSEPGTTELFTLSVGADGTRDVYLNEANGVDAKLAQVFGSTEHRLVLANNVNRPLERPFANLSAMRRALATFADRMDVNDDVLALVISSQGTPDHHLLVSMPPYEFDDLTPESLRSLLDESGIRYRVIILSACYSGGFVDALSNDDTLVITASAADRRSFACRDGDQWTDFGRAYFAEALNQTASFEEAFRVAANHIADQESRQGLTPSQPQIRVGRHIREQLKHLETRHDGRILFTRAGHYHSIS